MVFFCFSHPILYNDDFSHMSKMSTSYHALLSISYKDLQNANAAQNASLPAPHLQLLLAHRMGQNIKGNGKRASLIVELKVIGKAYRTMETLLFPSYVKIFQSKLSRNKYHKRGIYIVKENQIVRVIISLGKSSLCSEWRPPGRGHGKGGGPGGQAFSLSLPALPEFDIGGRY